MRPIRIGSIRVHLLWFDSLGAKSSSVLVETPEVRILLDPGAAEMQPSFPLPEDEKRALRKKALRVIKGAAKKAEVIFISHYHYDHHTLPEEAPDLYRGKVLWIKDPNRWINRSQWKRARVFLGQLAEVLGCGEPKPMPPEEAHFPDPMDKLPLAKAKDFGPYTPRRRELLEKGRRWFLELTRLWGEEAWVPPPPGVIYADGQVFSFGETRVRVSEPLFHGVEYDRVGWVLAVVVERDGRKLLYAPDLQGPIIEDYARWIIEEDPDLLILDGPPTYLLGYMLNLTNLNRAVENLCSILKEAKTPLIIYDHHFLREPNFRRHLARAYQVAEGEGKKLLTAAEWTGKTPLVEALGGPS